MYLRPIYIISGGLSAVSIVAMFLLIVAQVIARNLDTHIPSSDDISGYLVVWATYFGLSYAMYYSSHIRVELVLSRLNAPIARWLNIAVGGLACVLVAILLYYNSLLVFESYTYGDVTEGQLVMPLWVVQLPIMFGSLTFFFSVVEYTLKNLFENYKSEEQVVKEEML